MARFECVNHADLTSFGCFGLSTCIVHDDLPLAKTFLQNSFFIGAVDRSMVIFPLQLHKWFDLITFHH